jgi:RNA polymerase sigma factor (sigma-70 family)
MPTRDSHSEISPRKAEVFNTTHWSVVLSATSDSSESSRNALEKLCQTYWYPLYAYVRRQGRNSHDAQDLTQAFFARFLEKNQVQRADRDRGRFRTFLLTSLKNFLIKEWEKQRSWKRGGRVAFVSWDEETAERRFAEEPADNSTPEVLFEKRWAATLLENVLVELRREFKAAGKERLFEALKVGIWGEKNNASHAEIAEDLGMTEGAVKMTVHRLRQRYRDQLRQEIAHTVSSPEEVDEELRHLMDVVAS